MNHAFEGTKQIDADIGEVSRASSEASTSANETRDAAKTLSNQADGLSNEVGAFLDGIRAA